MYDMLNGNVGISEEAMDILLKVLGDTPETYKKILSKTTDFKTFQELEDYYRIEGCV